MNKLMIIGNLTNDPELRSTTTGRNVCNFTVAVNRRKRVSNQPDADFFRVAVWDALGENCAKYLAKGRKVMVDGSVSLRTYETQNGKHGASLEVIARDVEFLSPAEQRTEPAKEVDQQTGMEKVQDDDLPF